MIPYNEPLAFHTIAGAKARTYSGARVEPAGGFTHVLNAAAKGLELEDYRSNPVNAAGSRVAETPAIPVLSASLNAYDAYARSSANPDSMNEKAPQTKSPSTGSVSGQSSPSLSLDKTMETMVEQAALRHDLSPELISAVIQAESGFQTRAVSPAGAMGLMQLMPATARELGVDDPFDPAQNIEAGAKYLRQMLDLFDQDLEKALMAYNAGPGTVRRYDGQVPYAETLAYVDKVMANTGKTASA